MQWFAKWNVCISAVQLLYLWICPGFLLILDKSYIFPMLGLAKIEYWCPHYKSFSIFKAIRHFFLNSLEHKLYTISYVLIKVLILYDEQGGRRLPIYKWVFKNKAILFFITGVLLLVANDLELISPMVLWRHIGSSVVNRLFVAPSQILTTLYLLTHMGSSKYLTKLFT